MKNPREELMNHINKLLSGEWNGPTFDREYTKLALEIPQGALNDIEDVFFDLLREGLEWTTKTPDDDKKYGWMDEHEYIECQRAMPGEFLHDEEQWHSK